jgi:hypothetical protein
MKLSSIITIFFFCFVTCTIHAQEPSKLNSGISTLDQPATLDCDEYKLDSEMQITEGTEWMYRMTRCQFDSLSQRGRVIIYKNDGSLHSNMLVGNVSDLNAGCYLTPENGSMAGMIQLDYAYTGEFKTYHTNGQLKRDDYFEDGYLTVIQCYTAAGIDTAYYPYYQPVEYPGGEFVLQDYLMKNVVLPEIEGKKIKEGGVSIECAVDESGSITVIKVISATHNILKNEAIRVVSTISYFEPARLDGKVEKGSILIYVPFMAEPAKPSLKQKVSKGAMTAVFMAKMVYMQKKQKRKKDK